MKKAKYKFARIKNKLPFFAEVEIEVESSEKFEVRLNCSGQGFTSQGYLEEVPKAGYDDWKTGAKRGIEFAARQAACSNCLVTVSAIRGLGTDTNPVIIAAASALAFWDAVDFQPDKNLKEKIEAKVFSSWQNQNEFFD